jgi:hypothetical protein
LPGGKKETLLVFEVYEHGERVERIEERSLVGLTHRPAIQGFLAQTGFEVRKEWGDYGFTPYEEGAPLLIVEAVKRAPV